MLNKCFLASNHKLWIDNVFPFILDKLTAAQSETKIESLILIEQLIAMHAKEDCILEHI